jgi:putative transposase
VWIEKHRKTWPVAVICDVLKVSRSGFYAWLGRSQSKQAKTRRRLTVLIKAVHKESRETYGSPRVHAELKSRGEACCLNTVARYMRENDVAAKTKRKFKQTTDSNHKLPIAENLLNRQFTQTEPNRAWVSDITYVPTREGWLYLATVQHEPQGQLLGQRRDGEFLSFDQGGVDLPRGFSDARTCASCDL